MKNICILLLSFAFTQIVCAQSYNDSTSTGNVEVSKYQTFISIPYA